MGGEAGEASTPDLSTKNGSKAAAQFLEREEEAAGIFLQVGGVEISKKVWEDKMVADEGMKFFVIPHKQGRYQLACTPTVCVGGAVG
ncbi:MAG: hypothetical protein ACO3JL_16150 [Myxococcota bacterium]